MTDDSDLMKTVNEILESEYASLDEVPDEGIFRVYQILQISAILLEHPDYAVFTCRPGDIREGPQ